MIEDYILVALLLSTYFHENRIILRSDFNEFTPHRNSGVFVLFSFRNFIVPKGLPIRTFCEHEYPSARLCKELRMYLHRLRNAFCMLRELELEIFTLWFQCVY